MDDIERKFRELYGPRPMGRGFQMQWEQDRERFRREHEQKEARDDKE